MALERTSFLARSPEWLRSRRVDASDTPNFVDGIDAIGVGDGRFIATYPSWFEGDRVFGGLVLAQAVTAACKTVSGPYTLHSLHGYFLRPASPGEESVIDVDRRRDGRSFVTRETTTMVGGKETFVMTASFQRPEVGEEYQIPMARVAPPSEGDPAIERDGPFAVFEIGPTPIRPDGTYESTRRAWIRCRAELGADPTRHLAAAAYASDMTRAAFRPTSLGTWGEHLDASLDHAAWFHGVPDMTRWHLFDLHTVVTGGGRSFMRGTLSDDQGRLVLSMAQEILIRRLDAGAPIDFGDPAHPLATP